MRIERALDATDASNLRTAAFDFPYQQPIGVGNLSLGIKQKKLPVNASEQIGVSVTWRGGTHDVGRIAELSSSDTSIAVVDSSLTIIPRRIGTRQGTQASGRRVVCW